jgi:uncharacterized protein YndB with AHSA1/START domain
VTEERRTDRASRLIAATPAEIYGAFIDPNAMAKWMPPEGMTARFEAFEPRAGGAYRMVLEYEDASARGKSGANEDIVEGRFVELVPNERIVQRAVFESEDPSFAGAMTITWSFAKTDAGTRVDVVCADVPPGISKEDHDVGLHSSLENLAAHVE